MNGGEGGIRTHESLTALPLFESGPVNHLGTSPQEKLLDVKDPLQHLLYQCYAMDLDLNSPTIFGVIPL